MITIFTNIKDECRYLYNWIDYHGKLGIDKFILFEDEGSEPHDDIINKFNGIYNIILYKGLLPKNSPEYKDLTVFRLVFQNHPEISWGIKLDPDEYINIGNFSNIKQYIEHCCNKQSDVEEIILPWQMHNASNFVYPPVKYEYNLRATYQDIITEKNIGKNIPNVSGARYDVGKTFLNFKVFTDKSLKFMQDNLSEYFPHRLINTNKYYSAGENDGVFCEHYITKSFDEFFKRLTIKGEHDPEWYRTIGDFFELNPSMIHLIPELEKIYHFDINTLQTKLNVDKID